FLFFFSAFVSLLDLLSFPTRRSSDLPRCLYRHREPAAGSRLDRRWARPRVVLGTPGTTARPGAMTIVTHLLATTLGVQAMGLEGDRKSTRLNSSHLGISYAVFCLKKK